MTVEEQKIEFARRYYRNPTDAAMIAGTILGIDVIEKNPLEAINAGREWPYDSIVIAELDRLRNETKPKTEYVTLCVKSYEECMQRGEEKSAVEFLKLAMQAEGYLKQAAEKDKGGTHKLQELAAMLGEPTNRRE